MNINCRQFLHTFFTCIIILSCVGRKKIQPVSIQAESIPPQLVQSIPPFYPEEARQKGLTGKVGLHLFVTDSGKVEQVRIVSSSGFEVLDRVAVQYANVLRFKPASQAGRPTNTWMNWTVVYNIKEGKPIFHPIEYANKVLYLNKQLETADRNEQEKILEQILTLHKAYRNYVHENPELNTNQFIENIISQEVLTIWQPFWHEWVLSLVVFQDFLERFPDSHWSSEAFIEFNKSVQSDLNRITRLSEDDALLQKKRTNLIKLLKELLTSKYQ